MKRNDVINIVADIIETDASEIQWNSNLRVFPGFDSVNILSIMIALDDQVGIKLSPADAAKLCKLSDLDALAVAQNVELTD